MAEVVLFGVGQHTLKFINIIRFFGGNVDFLTDNDEKKINTKFEGLDVISPQVLMGKDCHIIISCIHWQEIFLQLSDMGVGDKQISLYSHLKLLLAKHNRANLLNVQIHEKLTICLDLFSGAEWGGAENWNITMAEALSRQGENVLIAGNKVPRTFQKELKVNQFCFSETDSFREFAEYFLSKLPLVFINSFFGDDFFVLLALKLMYPNRVHIISVLHNDMPEQYKSCTLFSEWIDRYMCVSSLIKNNLVNIYKVPPEKVFFIYQPIEFKVEFDRSYNDSGPLKLGMASRLVREQKRCDLIPQLIRCLELLQIDYVLDIAGDGELFDEISRHIDEYDLSRKVRLRGKLAKDEMERFWKAQDIYINISEYEGASLSMLEAMGAGCVPVVTDVSGTRDFIRDQYNGFICCINNINAIADRVKQIDENRRLLRQLGTNARREILSKCNLEYYANKLLAMIQGEMG